MFQLEPEKAHYFAMNSLQMGCRFAPLKKIIQQNCSFNHPKLEKKLWGLTFKNPVGLGAGFDKNAIYLDALDCLGFGFVEIGTVTPKPQLGNEKPRLFRLPKDKALINRMGFNNDGVLAIQKRLDMWRNKTNTKHLSNLIVGANIGKNKDTPNEEASSDYCLCFNSLYDTADYFVLNVSSPNTPGLRALQEKEALREIVSKVQNANYGKTKPKPILLKIAPDLSNQAIDDIIELAEETKLAGLVISNTTIGRETLKHTSKVQIDAIGAGGLSGAPLYQKSNNILNYVATQTQYRLPIIGSGGIFTGEQAVEKIKMGASLIQVWTGFIYEGPGIAKNICKTILQSE